MWDSTRRTHLVRDWDELDSSDNIIAYLVRFISIIANYFPQRWPVKKILVSFFEKISESNTDTKNISETAFEYNQRSLFSPEMQIQ